MLGLPRPLSQAELLPRASGSPLAAGPRDHGECAGADLVAGGFKVGRRFTVWSRRPDLREGKQFAQGHTVRRRQS